MAKNVVFKIIADTEDFQKELARNIQLEKELNSVLDKQIKTQKDAEAQNKILRQLRKEANTETEQGRRVIEKANATIDRNTEYIRKNADTMKKQQMDIGNYKKVWEGFGSALLKMGGIIAGAAGAWEGFKKVMASTAATADKFEAVMSGLGEATQEAFRGLLKLDFSNVIRAFTIGKEYAETMDALIDRRNAMGVEEAKFAKQIAELTIAMRNQNLSVDERISKAKELLELEKSIAEQRKIFATEELIADQKRLFQLTGVTAAQQRNYQLQLATNPKIIEQATVLAEKLAESDKNNRAYSESMQKSARDRILADVKDIKLRDVVIAKYNIESKAGQDRWDKVLTSMTNYYNENARFDQETARAQRTYNSLIKELDADQIKSAKDKRDQIIKINTELRKGTDWTGFGMGSALEQMKPKTVLSKEEKDRLKIQGRTTGFNQELFDEYNALLKDAQKEELTTVELKYTDLLNAEEKYGFDKVALTEKYNSEINAINEKYAALEKQQRDAKIQDYGNMFVALGNMLSEFGVDNKIAALAQVAIDTGMAISSLVAMSQANPANALTFGGAGAAQFAAGIIQILTNVAQARNIIMSSNPVKKADGGMIYGAGTGNSDSIPAMLSNGEAVVNARSMSSGDIMTLSGTPKEIISYINSYKGYGRRFSDGFVPDFAGSKMTGIDNSNVSLHSMAKTIVDGINDKKVIQDIRGLGIAQTRYSTVTQRGKW